MYIMYTHAENEPWRSPVVAVVGERKREGVTRRTKLMRTPI